jgi:hypothetical protein
MALNVTDALTLSETVMAELLVLEAAVVESLILSEGIVGIWMRQTVQGSARQGQGTRGHMQMVSIRRPAGGGVEGSGSTT